MSEDDERKLGTYEPPSRKQVLRWLEIGLQESKRKIEKGRVRDSEREKVRQGWVRALAYAVNSYRKMINDERLEEMEDQIEDLKEELGHE